MNEDVPELPAVSEDTVISTRDQLQALRSPMRMRILAACKQPQSIRQLAERFNVPKTTLYHHVNRLVEAGFVEVVHVRKSGARLERVFRVTGNAITAAPDFTDTLGDPMEAAHAFVTIVLEPTRVEAEAAFADRLQGGAQHFFLGRDQATLTHDDAQELITRLRDFVREYVVERNSIDHPDAHPYALTYAFTRTDPG